MVKDFDVALLGRRTGKKKFACHHGQRDEGAEATQTLDIIGRRSRKA